MVARTARQTMHSIYNFHTRNKSGSVVIRLRRVACRQGACRGLESCPQKIKVRPKRNSRDLPESPKTMKTLREAINEAVVGHLKDKLETGEGIDVAEMAHELTQSLVDMIMEQEEEHQAPLLASIVVSLGDEYLQRRGFIETRPRQH
jgi:DNA-binding protein Fis